MRSDRAIILSVLSIFLITAMGMAQSTTAAQPKPGIEEKTSEKLQNGEAGYTAGCSFAASLGKVVCGELPSGKQAQKDQDAADASGAIAAVQKLHADAGETSKSSSEALQNLQAHCDDSADTCAAVAAALQKMQQASDDVIATTPDAFTVTQPYTAAPPEQKIPAYTFGQRVINWGILHIPSQETQNTPPDTSASEQSTSETNDLQTEYQKNLDQYSDALQQYQQALQNFTNLISNLSSKKTVTNWDAIPHFQGPQIRANDGGSIDGIPWSQPTGCGGPTNPCRQRTGPVIGTH